MVRSPIFAKDRAFFGMSLFAGLTASQRWLRRQCLLAIAAQHDWISEKHLQPGNKFGTQSLCGPPSRRQ
jgi:hypothetical protein